ncbi:DNA polymerase epsilon subunit 4 [Plutella xylostella]|uniref:DNA polymerase epsilon subunit 4 n=1 Tax=Plutella xylostella TaxID=51655 RepID=UPI00203271FE|nr:DNA polymerase epsilon subunit 4 [Plutella xylostella]
MAEEEHYTDIDISDVIEDTEQCLDSENPLSEAIESETLNTIQDSEVLGSEDQLLVEKTQQSNKTESIKTTRLPLSRIKQIMKMDPDVHLVQADAVFLVAKATEMFLETIAKETYTFTATKKRKTIAKKDLDTTINMVDCLCFLEGAVDF